jgi:nicotinate-nucleotide adenylyltransferase
LGQRILNVRRIGLFGGTFDPVHNAHVALASTARDSLALDELRWVPAGQPWQKARPISAAAHREAMVRLAIEGHARFTLDRIEIERSGPSYTLDTVRELQRREPGHEWVLVIGWDQYCGLHTWLQWQTLLGCVTLAVAARPGETRPVHPEVAALAHRMVPLPMMDISSTDIRARVAQGQSITHLVPAAVARYIEQQALYGAASRS